MKTQQSGFSVIELVVSMMLASILMTASLTIYNQITKSMSKMQTMITTDTSIMIFKHRLSAELQGLCPLWYSQRQQKELEKKTDAKKKSQNAEDAEPETPKTALDHPYLFAKIDENSLVLTFVTTNSLSNYPYSLYRCARVVYKLTQDPKNAQLFQLQRKEESPYTPNINLEQLAQGTFYPIVNHVKQCSIEYGIIERQKKSDPHPGALGTKITWAKEWQTPDPKKQEKKDSNTDDDDAQQPNAPDMIKIMISTQESPEAPIKEHELQFYLIVSSQFTMPTFSEEKAPQQPTKTEANSATPPKIA